MQTDLPAFLDRAAQAILVEQAAIEAVFPDILDLPSNHPAVLVYAERLHAHATHCLDFAQRVRFALNPRLN